MGKEVGRRRKAGRQGEKRGWESSKTTIPEAEGVDEGMQGRRVELNEWEPLSGLAFHTKAVPFPPNSYFLKGGSCSSFGGVPCSCHT